MKPVLASALPIVLLMAVPAAAVDVPPLPVCDTGVSQTVHWEALGENVTLETRIAPVDQGGSRLINRATLDLVLQDGTRLNIGRNDKIIDDWGPEGVTCDQLLETARESAIWSLERDGAATPSRDGSATPAEQLALAVSFDTYALVWSDMQACKDDRGAWRDPACERAFKGIDENPMDYEHFRLFQEAPDLAARLSEARAPLLIFSSAYSHETLVLDRSAKTFHRMTTGGC